MANPKRISDLPPVSDVLSTDQVLISRGSGVNGESFRASVDSFLRFNVNNASDTIQHDWNSNVRTLRSDLKPNYGEALNPYSSKPQHFVLAAPATSSGAPSFRLLDPYDIPALSASQVTSGEFDPDRIPGLDGSKITSGLVAADRISNLDSSKITSGVLAVARIPNLDADKIVSGVLAVARIPNLNADKINPGMEFDLSNIPDLPISRLTTGVLPTIRGGTGVQNAYPNTFFAGPIEGIETDPVFRQLNQVDIPSLHTSKVTEGIFSVERIPDLDSSKITTGILNIQRIPNFDASKVTSGVLSVDRIPDLPYTKVIGIFDPENIPFLDASKINSGVFDVRLIPDLDAEKIISGIINVQRIPNLDAVKITSGVFPTQRIEDKAITPEKLSLGGPTWTSAGDFLVAKDFLAGGNITASGNVTAFSDKRLKEDIKTIENALQIVSSLRGVKFKRKNSDRKEIGVIGQEIKEVLPEATYENEDGYISVAYGNIVSVLIEAVKELIREVNPELLQNKNWDTVRAIRNNLLQKTDWIDLPSSPTKNKEQWLKYRQELRDIPQTYSNLDEVIWPLKPTNNNTK